MLSRVLMTRQRMQCSSTGVARTVQASRLLTMWSRIISRVTQLRRKTKQSAACHWVVFFTHLPKSTWTTTLGSGILKHRRRIVTVRDETRSHLEFRQRDVADGMRLLSKLPADVVSKSFQEVITFAGHWALRHPLWPSRLASSSSFLRGFLHLWLPFLLVAGTGSCGVDLIEYLATLILKFESAPSRSRGWMVMAATPCRFFPYAVHQTWSSCPCTVTVH